MKRNRKIIAKGIIQRKILLIEAMLEMSLEKSVKLSFISVSELDWTTLSEATMASIKIKKNVAANSIRDNTLALGFNFNIPLLRVKGGVLFKYN